MGGRRVLVTGHTGFKGSWLTFWLSELGAEVAGLGLAPATEPSLFEILSIKQRCSSRIANINDAGCLAESVASFNPEVIIHMAAQAIVRTSYVDPIGTYNTNVMGVVRLLDAVRKAPSVRSVVIVTSDKCYENLEQIWGYREGDRLGGHDPYSSSKGAAEIAAQSMQRSFFQPFVSDGHAARIATVRAGNVIGGGDWSEGRLVPDIVRGCLGVKGEVNLRNPNAVRPWQHVLDPLGAYLEIAERLITAPEGIDGAWNIGPESGDVRAVVEVARSVVNALGGGRITVDAPGSGPHEATLLTLDCTKARIKLGWKPRLQVDECLRWTVDWYAQWKQGHDMIAVTRAQLRDYEAAGASAELYG